MRIGIDLTATQSDHRTRGIGRYVLSLARALAAGHSGPRGHEWVGYGADSRPASAEWAGLGLPVRRLADGGSPGRALQALVDANPDRLDAFLLTNPVDLSMPGYLPPRRAVSGLPLFAVFYDLIPAVYQDEHLRNHAARPYYRSLEALRGYDGLLCISEATAHDAADRLGLPARKVHTVHAGSDGDYFRPPADDAASRAADAATLARLGIRGEYLYCVGAGDFRKNVPGLVRAYALLPRELRERFPLVVSGKLWLPRHGAEREVESAGLGDSVVFTDYVDDDTLRLLYQRCAALAFPSLYEGFGLPLLEAMQCGAPVVAGDNSSQAELVGDAGLLANAHDPVDFADKLRRVLSDAELRAELSARGLAASRAYTWARTAALTARAIERTPAPRVVRSTRLAPPLSLFAPMPPTAEAVLAGTGPLYAGLSEHFDVDLFHEPDLVPAAALREPLRRCYDARSFAARDRCRGYAAALYCVGNAGCFAHAYAAAVARPGVVALLADDLRDLHAARPGLLAGELMYELFGDRPAPELPAWLNDPAEVAGRVRANALPLLRRLLDRGRVVLVPSAAARDALAERYPESAAKLRVVPVGLDVDIPREDAVAELRRRLGIAPDRLVFAVWCPRPNRRSADALFAFAAIAHAHPRAELVLLGCRAEADPLTRLARELRVAGRVRLMAHPSAGEAQAVLGAADLGIHLRSSDASADGDAPLWQMLRRGLPVVADPGLSYAGVPEGAVTRLPEGGNNPVRLSRLLFDFAADAGHRAGLRAAARAAAAAHAWPAVLPGYLAALDESREPARRSAAA